ncbi:hypothetical protein LCGC14_2941410, partial [marine sediment metagenome]
MPGKNLHQEPFSEETITKLDIFERYLEKWLPVFIQAPHWKTVNICDFFAGPGEDSVGQLGSPLRFLHVIHKYKKAINEQGLQVNLLLNEYEGPKFTILEGVVAEHLQRLPELQEHLKVECTNRDFKELFSEKRPTLAGTPNLIFLDQNGVKQTTETVFLDLVGLPQTDFLFFISSSSFRRFAEHPSFKEHFPDLDPARIRDARYEDIHRVVLDYYEAKLPPGNSTRLYPFSIKKGANIYGLVFGTGHFRGAEKFLEIAWNKNRLNGEANFDIDDDAAKAQKVLFPQYERPTKLQRFKRELKEFILEGHQITNKDVYIYALEHGHLPSHAGEVVKRLKKEGK